MRNWKIKDHPLRFVPSSWNVATERVFIAQIALNVSVLLFVIAEKNIYYSHTILRHFLDLSTKIRKSQFFDLAIFIYIVHLRIDCNVR